MHWKIWQEKRHVLVFLIALGTFTLYIFRVNLSIAIVAMTSDTFETLENGTTITHEAEFQWDTVLQGYLLSAFFYGYAPTPIVGALVGNRIGGKKALGLTVAFTSIFALISPWLAEWSPYAFLASRVCTGLLEGLTYPGMYVLFSKWIPENEKSRATSQVHAGNYVGTVFSMLFFGFLADMAGWRSLFWFSGALGALWVVVWVTFVTETPREHPSITNRELLYIEDSVKTYQTEKTEIPWKILLSSLSVWACNFAVFCENWGFFVIVTLLPKYYNDVYNFDLSTTGVLSALPYICLAIMMMVIGQVTDRVIARKWFSVTITRKICICGGYLIEACFILGAAFWENISGNVFCLVMAVSVSSLSKSAVVALPVDIAPQWCGLIYGIGLTFAAAAGMISPTISGYVLSIYPTIQGWRIVFYITSGLMLLGIVAVLLFGSAEKLNFSSSEATLVVEPTKEELGKNVDNLKTEDHLSASG